ncbi:MAG TPA: zinc dependent phospholipase C family protein [Bryobacteraceae bacterium]|nr:zinc dependent phospholipase C family protein [Bryobacteraceae bacterium]
MLKLWKLPAAACAGLLLLLTAPVASSYSVLTHEAIIDSVWDSSIKGLLLQRFPDATADELAKAHGYAYGGSIIQDMGYCPFGSRFFSDLLHYVRSGDFILSLIRNSQDLNEYAFSLGALAHYAADNDGHSIAVNLAVPLLYPKLGLQFGKQVTYGDDALSHTKTEFAFDVLQVAQGHYAPDGYHQFIGFEVSRPLLERAFQETYGMKLEQVFTNVSLAIGSYRRSISSSIPTMTRVAWQLKKDEIIKDAPSITRKKFLYNLSRASYQKSWGNEYQRPGFRSRLLTFCIRLMPRVGRSRALAFRTPTPAVEKMFMASFNSTLDRYRALLSAQKAGRLELPNRNFDIGELTGAGTYKLSDEAYAHLLGKLEGHYPDMPADLRLDILAYYGDLSAPISTKTDAGDWAKVIKELDALKIVSVGAALLQ